MALSSSIPRAVVAGNVHPHYRTGLPATHSSALSMNRDFQIRFTAGFLALFTAAAITLAWINFQKEGQFVAPYDGVSWVERTGGIYADRVESEGPGARAGIAAGDRLLTVNGAPVSAVDTLVQRMYAVGAYFKIRYSLQRGTSIFDAAPILSAQEHTFNNWLRLIGLIYLGIGLYVLFRRWTAPGSTHFYVFCLVSFAFCSFHFTGKLNSFDRTIYWGNILANMLQPALLLHFVLTFPERSWILKKYRWLATSIYLPGLLLLSYHLLAVAPGATIEISDFARQRNPAVAVGSCLDGISGYLLRCCIRSVVTQLQRGQKTNSPPAVEMAHEGHDSRDFAFHAAVCAALRFPKHRVRTDEVVGGHAGRSPADLWIRDLPLQTDGR